MWNLFVVDEADMRCPFALPFDKTLKSGGTSENHTNVHVLIDGLLQD